MRHLKLSGCTRPLTHKVSWVKQGEMSTSTLVFFVNGRKVVEKEPDPECTLLVYLRGKLRLCGTKIGCGEGACGACTVMVSFYDKEMQRIKHLSVNACLMPVCAVHGCAVTTVEGIGSTKTKLHAIQEKMSKMHASQCGFCTPGIVMSMYALLRNKPKPTMLDVDEYFKGNLCRCTGYRPILESMRTLCVSKDSAREKKNTKERMGLSNDTPEINSLSKSSEGVRREENGLTDLVTEAYEAASNFETNAANIVKQYNGLNEGCCGGKKGKCCMEEPSEEVDNTDAANDTKYSENRFAPYDPSQEPIFPPELLLDKEAQSLVFRSNRVTWYRPVSLEEVFQLKAKLPEAKIVPGNTEVGIETKSKDLFYGVILHPSHVKELNKITVESDGLKFGASATLDDIEEACRKTLDTLPAHQGHVLSAFVEMMQWFAGKQIRNVASIGGNIMTGSPIADINPILMAAKCKLEVASISGRRSLILDENFYTGYRKTCLQPEEVLLSIKLPFTNKNEFFQAFKQAKRRDEDIAIVNAAFRVSVHEQVIKEATICYGGLAPTTKMAKKSMEVMIGRAVNEETLRATLEVICKEFDLPPNAPGGMVRYRRALAVSLFFKFFVHVAKGLGVSSVGLLNHGAGAVDRFQTQEIKCHQFFKLSNTSNEKHPVGQPIPHKSGELHTTGEAVYVDDMVKTVDELDLVFITSTIAHANILKIDAEKALLIDGVVDFVSCKDLPPENNCIGIPGLCQDEEVFASKTVHCVGQVIGAVLAKGRDTAKRAAKEVVVHYEELPAILTIAQAIKMKSFYDKYDVFEMGNLEEAFANCDHIIEGEMITGAQEHFYLETQSCLVVPLNENNEIHVYSATQGPSHLQEMVAKTLGVEHNRVVCETKRVGGGFGGKETRSSFLAASVAVAARKVGRPVRMTLDRDEDMTMTGTRHPFLGKYKVGFNKDGQVTALHVDLFSNAGWSHDFSLFVMRCALFRCEASYYVPNVRFTGRCCKTNLPSNTAFRGFGSKQSNMIAETWIDDVASFLNKDPAEVRQINLYKGGELTHYNQIMEPGVRRCWDECLEKSGYCDRKREIKKFNDMNRWKKRGLAIIPVMYGVGYEIAFMNKGAALVSVYLDGSVLLNHGGVEMGQGLHTKMIQIASNVLGIPHSRIFTSSVATDKIPNNTNTSASCSSDLYGMAVVDACSKIMERLKPYKKHGTKWEDWVQAANFDRVSLSATGYYATPEIGYDYTTNSGKLYSYFTFGAGCSVVEIDCLTGDHKILRTDIVMDVGESLNPAIDIGQIEGAFTQGYGFFVLEQIIHTPKGELITRGPSTYKIPGFGDVPAEFNVYLLSGSPNLRAVYSSRAIGEPPLFLGASVYFAIKDAIRYARADAGLHGIFKLEAPATAERIRMACEDDFTKMVPHFEEGSYIPWSIQV